jgi:predicted Abi (CAAX) family protease
MMSSSDHNPNNYKYVGVWTGRLIFNSDKQLDDGLTTIGELFQDQTCGRVIPEMTLQRGWIGTRPISDIIVDFEPMTRV